MIEAKVVADSVSKTTGKRITTLQVKFHRFILPEFNTHRVFSRNFSSSRAIPTSKLIDQVRNDPATPVHWGKNQPGMQAQEELSGLSKKAAQAAWLSSAKEAALRAEVLLGSGVHKQIVNRVLEPYLWAHGIVTSTEWDNFFELRAHPDAQPEIQELAVKIRKALSDSIPVELGTGDWHLPYITNDEYTNSLDIEELKMMSAARCCRVSYLKHDGSAPSKEDDIALFQRLAGSVPIHASPLEHQATPDTFDFHRIKIDDGFSVDSMKTWRDKELHGNLDGWIQYRKLWELQIYAGAKPR